MMDDAGRPGTSGAGANSRLGPASQPGACGEPARLRPLVAVAGSAFRMIPRPGGGPYHRVVKRVAARGWPRSRRGARNCSRTRARRRAGRRQRGLAPAVPGISCTRCGWPLVLVDAPGPPARLAPGQAGRDRPGHRGRAGGLRQDRLRVRAVPAGARDRVLHDHRPARSGSGAGSPACWWRRGSRCRRPRPATAAVRHHLPGDDLRSRPRRRACSAGPSGPASGPRRAGPTAPRPSSTGSPRRPPSASGPGSPASCTTWWRTT